MFQDYQYGMRYVKKEFLGRVNTFFKSGPDKIHGMEIVERQYEQIKDLPPRQLSNVKLRNIDVLNAISYVTENGCKRRSLPKCSNYSKEAIVPNGSRRFALFHTSRSSS